MGEAIVRCLLAKTLVGAEDMIVSDISPSRRELLTNEYRISTCADNRKAVQNAELVILAVKPGNLRHVMEDIKGLAPEQLVLSIVAGATLTILSRGLDHTAIVRAMPNMPAQIGQGMTVWTAAAGTKQKQKELAQTVLGALGRELYVADEKYLGMATALSGSGPAYVFLFIEALVDAGVHIGLPRDVAQQLVTQTILGSTITVDKTGKHPADLRNTVTSPGGTTTEALLHLEKGGFRSLLLEAVAAAYQKAEHL